MGPAYCCHFRCLPVASISYRTWFCAADEEWNTPCYASSGLDWWSRFQSNDSAGSATWNHRWLGLWRIPFRERSHIPPKAKMNIMFKSVLGRDMLCSQEGILILIIHLQYVSNKTDHFKHNNLCCFYMDETTRQWKRICCSSFASSWRWWNWHHDFMIFFLGPCFGVGGFPFSKVLKLWTTLGNWSHPPLPYCSVWWVPNDLEKRLKGCWAHRDDMVFCPQNGVKVWFENSTSFGLEV